MNQNNSNIPLSGDMKNVSTSKSLKPATSGVSNSHGIKLSARMTSEDKKQFLLKLEEWKKTKRERLAASILTKQKQAENSKTSTLALPQKKKLLTVQGRDGNLKIQNQESVFERLYKNSGKRKKQEFTSNLYKPTVISDTNFKKTTLLPTEKPSKAVKICSAEKEETESLLAISLINKENKIPTSHMETSALNSGFESVNYIVKTDGQMDGDDSIKCFFEEETEIKQTIKFKSQPVRDIIKQTEKKSVQSGSVPAKEVEVEKKKNPLRRSISMKFRQKSRKEFAVRRSISAKNLHEINVNLQKIKSTSLQTLPLFGSDIINKTKQDTPTKSVSLVTPKNNSRPLSPHLRNKLDNWLKVNEYSVEGYRHKDIINDAKLCTAASAITLDNSFENLCHARPTGKNTPADNSEKENVMPHSIIPQVNETGVENWLKELHPLIVEHKHPPKKFEELLTAIRSKCLNCAQLPIYWECLAALHESKGDMKSATEDYEQATIKGSEVDLEGNSLVQLFDKMVIEETNSKRKLEKGLDPKNIFKSTTIKFALQQKALKKPSSENNPTIQQLYIATPVRRSTRIQSPFKSNEEVASLHTLTPRLLKNLNFKPNESLLLD